MAYDGSSAQPPMEFPLSGSGPPVCVSLGHPTKPGCVRSVHDERTDANVIELSSVIRRAVTPAEKFYLEPSKQHEGLLHVRCCEGGKYWAAQQLVNDSTSPWFIGGIADKPEEDLMKPSCTLFSIMHDHTRHIDGGHFRLFHSHQRKYACMSLVSGPGNKNYLQLRDHLDYDTSLFRIRRLSDQRELPKYVAFKDHNGMYLTSVYMWAQYPGTPPFWPNMWCARFKRTDITNPDVIHETFTDEYGVVRIRHNASGKFLSVLKEHNDIQMISAPGGIVHVVEEDAGFDSNSGISEDTIYKDVNTLFKVVIKDGTSIALQALGNGKFCRSSPDFASWLSLEATSVDGNKKEATFHIEEPVRSREIYDMHFRDSAGKITSTKNVNRTEVLSTNRTHETHNAQTTIEMYDRIESTWDASQALDVGIKAHVSASLPGIMDGGVESHADFHEEYNWGEAKENKSKRSIQYSYPVPPMTKVVFSIVTREDVVDVPFSYTQKDVLVSGEEIPAREVYGGIYHGMKSTDVDIDTREEKIE